MPVSVPDSYSGAPVPDHVPERRRGRSDEPVTQAIRVYLLVVRRQRRGCPQRDVFALAQPDRLNVAASFSVRVSFAEPELLTIALSRVEPARGTETRETDSAGVPTGVRNPAG